MRVSDTNKNISFGAKFITTAQIQHIVKNKYVEQGINFVELERDNHFDRLAIYDLIDNWRQKLVYNFYNNFSSYSEKQSGKYYAITSQEDKFDKLESNKIIGLINLYKAKKDSYFVGILQSNPKYIEKDKITNWQRFINKICHIFHRVSPIDTEYNHAGKSMLDVVKDYFKANKIELISLDNAKGFYESQGFHKISKDEDEHRMVWLR